jgi:hypothetical protein
MLENSEKVFNGVAASSPASSTSPLSQSSGAIQMDEDGDLLLEDGDSSTCGKTKSDNGGTKRSAVVPGGRPRKSACGNYNSNVHRELFEKALDRFVTEDSDERNE